MSDSLVSQVEGATRPSQLITWLGSAGTPIDLTGATITGCLQDIYTGTSRAIAGYLIVTNPIAGQFRWDYDADDVQADGVYLAQFTATYPLGPITARSKAIYWTVEPSLCISRSGDN